MSDPDGGTNPDPDSGVCEPSSPPLELAACGTTPTRTGEPGDRGDVGAGDATVESIETIDGTTQVTLAQGDAERVVVLPAAPALVEGDTVTIEADGAALTIALDGVFVAFAGGLVPSGDLEGVLRSATEEAGAAPLALGDVELQVEALCASSAPHHDPRFCADVGLVSYGLRFGDTLVTPGESVDLAVDGRPIAVAIESITRRDDRYSESCEPPCADYWYSSFDVALVPLPAP